MPIFAFFRQKPLRNSIAMATPKLSCDQKTILKGVLYVKTISQKVSASFT